MFNARRGKIDKYRPFLRGVQAGAIPSLPPGSAIFIPFVLNASGGIEGGARRFLASICGYNAKSEFHWTPEFFDYYAAIRAISLAAQRARALQTVACVNTQTNMRRPLGSFEQHFGAKFERRGAKPNILRNSPPPKTSNNDNDDDREHDPAAASETSWESSSEAPPDHNELWVDDRPPLRYDPATPDPDTEEEFSRLQLEETGQPHPLDGSRRARAAATPSIEVRAANPMRTRKEGGREFVSNAKRAQARALGMNIERDAHDFMTKIVVTLRARGQTVMPPIPVLEKLGHRLAQKARSQRQDGAKPRARRPPRANSGKK